MQWYLKVLKNYVGFSGRASRTEFWMFNLINGIILVVLLGLTFATTNTSSSYDYEEAMSISPFYWVYLLYALGVALPGLAVSVRRLHDTDKSGWWLLLNFLPFGGIVLFIFWVMPGTDGYNDYGPDPWGDDDEYDEYDEYDDGYEDDYNYRPQNNARGTTSNRQQSTSRQYERQNSSRSQQSDAYNLDQPYPENKPSPAQKRPRQQADSLTDYKDPFSSDPNEKDYYQRFGLSDEEFKAKDNTSDNPTDKR